MSLPKINTYEVKMARSGHEVPVVNGVHLHSIYNPRKEAENLAEAQLEILEKKNEVLIMGLGFGYHVNAIVEKLTKFHNDNFSVIVIEPNAQVFEECSALNLINKKNVLIYSGFSSNELYKDIDLIHFLLRKPAMVAHPPSFNLYHSYYKNILTFEAPQNIKYILEYISAKIIKNYLSAFNPETTMDEVLYGEIPSKSQYKETDFLAMALFEMTKSNHAKKLTTMES